MSSIEIRARRIEIVNEHVAAEARGDWAGALATFARPRYEILATDETHDGSEAVARFYAESARAFPDLSFEMRAQHVAGDAVVAEVVFTGTQRGPWRGLPPTGRRVRYPMCNVFVFEQDRLVCERMYFDLGTPMRQLGIARDPTTLAGRAAIFASHPLTVTSAFVRQALGGR